MVSVLLLTVSSHVVADDPTAVSLLATGDGTNTTLEWTVLGDIESVLGFTLIRFDDGAETISWSLDDATYSFMDVTEPTTTTFYQVNAEHSDGETPSNPAAPLMWPHCWTIIDLTIPPTVLTGCIFPLPVP